MLKFETNGDQAVCINKTKNIKNVTRCRESRSAKAGKQGRDDSIKQFSAPPPYISLMW